MPSYQAELSVVDQANPNMPLPVWFTFATDKPDEAVKALQAGIERTAHQLPFLGGKVDEDAEDAHKMKLTWSDEDPKIPFEEVPGPDLPSYAELAAKGFPIHDLDFNFFPPSLIAAFTPGTKPAFSIAFTKLKGGLIVMFGPHHSMLDGSGLAVIMGIVAQNTRDPTFSGGQISPQEPLHRIKRLTELLNKSPKAIITDEEKQANSAPKPKEGVVPAQEPPTAADAKIFFFSIKRLEALRHALLPHTQRFFSLNTMVTSILWGLTGAARSSRLELASKAAGSEKVIHHSELSINVNSRQFFERESILKKGDWIGNLGTYTPWKPWADLHFLDESDVLTIQVDGLPTTSIHTGETGLPSSMTVPIPKAVPTLIDRVNAALAPLSLASVAADFEAANNRVQAAASEPGGGLDRRLLRDGNLASAFNGINFTVTYWNSLDMLPDFGAALGGRPTYTRLPKFGVIDGMTVMMPRHRTPDVGEAALDRYDVLMILRPEDMAKVLKSPMLQALLYAPPV